MADQKTTLKNIAEQLGTSKITVSRALKGQSGVSDALRRRVQKLAAELGYEYRRLRIPGQKSQYLFLTPKRFYLATDSFYHVIYYHLSTLCQANNITLSLGILEKDAESQGILPEGAASADSIIIGGELAGPALQAVAALGLPYVAVDHNVITESADCVIIDNYMAGSIAAEYLIKRGYTRIGFVGSYDQSSNIADRIHGVSKALRQQGLPFPKEWLVNNYDFATDNYILDIPLPADMPQAFICHCDRAAYYFIEKLKSAGLTVPGDAAIISIDNTDLAARCTPPLTSINIDKYRFAEAALQLLTERIEGRTKAQRIYLDTEIIERDSVPVRAVICG